jgi:hypothetical protein
MSSKNLFFSLYEQDTVPEKKTEVTYESLMETVNEQSKTANQSDEFLVDEYTATELDYNENYTKKQLEFIANYYDISVRKKKKLELVETIVVFEKEHSNYDIVNRRKTLWFYLDEISNDCFLSKFLILN